ncbi:condensation domain-containing protein [Uliginosibacterium sp. H3]|uniref:Condensation domain-containing protein n=1 Tax=Uliginosibacterium silvisoli TaxID=3114758 RepID=A0ABU6K7X0_9RHOO|nr:condensation domain-containing protein [Uliginosibacterium sp. H3]
MFRIDPSLTHAREISYAERRDLSSRRTAKGVNLCRFRTVDGVLDVAALRRALRQLALRHEALRTHFEKDATGAPIRRVEAEAEIPCVQLDLREFSVCHEQVRIQALAVAEEAFPADASPLARIGVLEVANAQTVIVISIAALIADGQAVAIIIRELSELYLAEVAKRAPDLPELEYGLSAFVASQVAWMQSPAYRERVAQLQERLHGQIEKTGGVAQLHFSPETKDSFLLDREFPAGFSEMLVSAARIAKVTVPTALMALTGLSVARARDVRGLFFTSTFSNRSINGTANLVGYLSTTMPSFLDANPAGGSVECVKALHREFFLLMSQFGMIPISEISPGIAECYPPAPAGSSIKFGKIVMDVTQNDFSRLFGLPSRTFQASIAGGLGAEYKFVFRAPRSGAVELWVKGLRQSGSEELALRVIDELLPSSLASMCN